MLPCPFPTTITITPSTICIDPYLVFLFHVYGRVCPGTIIVFCFVFLSPQIFPAVQVLCQYSPMPQTVLAFLVEILVSHQLLVRILLLLLSKVQDTPKKISGKFALRSFFSFSVSVGDPSTSLQNVLDVKQVEHLYPVRTEEVLRSLHDKCI